jgi:hypothetical protein
MIELAYAGLIICSIVTQDIDENSPDKERLCEYKCQDKRKNEMVWTDAQYQCPRILYVEPENKKDG